MTGGGIVRDVLAAGAEEAGSVHWTAEVGNISRPLREHKHGHRAGVVIIHDDLDQSGQALAASLEEWLWSSGHEVYRVGCLVDDLHKAGTHEIELRSISFGRVAGLVNAGQVVILTVPWKDDFTHEARLRLPGLEAVGAILQVRFLAPGAQPPDLPNDVALLASDSPRSWHERVKAMLMARLHTT